jgi:hypothetical protein
MRVSVFGRALAAIALSATIVHAQTSRLNFIGSANIQDYPADPTKLLIDFLDGANQTVAGTPTGSVEARPSLTGVFSTIVSGTQGTIGDLVVSDPSGITTLASPFLAIGGYTFTLTGAQASGVAPGGFNFGAVTVNPSGLTGSTATLFVNGNFSGPGVTGSQAYTGLFTAQFSDLTPSQLFAAINGQPQGLTARSFSAEFTFSPVPEPATVALMATGLVALFGGTVIRRRNQA